MSNWGPVLLFSAVAGLGVASLLLPEQGLPARTSLHESPYNVMVVEHSGTEVTFRHTLSGGIMSRVDRAQPEQLLTAYIRAMFIGAALKPDPKAVLQIGLGAGSLNRAFVDAYPDVPLTTVEIDPMIVGLARTEADFVPGPTNAVVTEDARAYVRDHEGPWDWILIDAFDRDSRVPAHLTTLEFHKLVRSRLTPEGVVVVNLQRGTAYARAQAATMLAVYPQVAALAVPTHRNLLLIASAFETPALATMVAQEPPASAPPLDAYGVSLDDLMALTEVLDSPYDLGPGPAPLLTDDHAPVSTLALQP